MHASSKEENIKHISQESLQRAIKRNNNFFEGVYRSVFSQSNATPGCLCFTTLARGIKPAKFN